MLNLRIMKTPKNPFLFQNYHSPKYFCDRNNEVNELISAFDNGRNLTLLSIRRLGKTGLIHHMQYKLGKRKDVVTVYLDILNTSNQQDFVNKFVTAIVNSIEKKKETFINKIIRQVTQYKPTFSVDTLTGNPQITLNVKNANEVRMSLDAIFTLIAEEKIKFQITIDEFQQISQYPNNNLDATLREYIQKLDNVHFIFCGSIHHMMVDLFSNVKKPLYRMTGFLHLDKIAKSYYAKFIKKHFGSHSKTIEDELVEEILDWTKNHTFYTQYFCNVLFSITSDSKITSTDMQRVKQRILKENEITYLNYKKLMTTKQWNLVKAIGKESQVSQPSANAFISKHNLGAGSTVRQSLKSMLAAEMIYETLEADSSYYQVYDVFFERWLQAVFPS